MLSTVGNRRELSGPDHCERSLSRFRHSGVGCTAQPSITVSSSARESDRVVPLTIVLTVPAGVCVAANSSSN